MFNVDPTNVAAPLVPVVVRVSASCLPLNVFQSVEVKAPVVVVLAVAILIAGVAPPLEDIGEVPVTEVTPTDTSPLPNNEVELTVLILVPLTRAACFPLNVFQSVDVNAPVVEVSAVAMLMVGVVPPDEAIGAVAPTDVTPPEVAASMIS